MVADLRARCSWDRVQTRQTLRPYLVEEVLELDEALGSDDVDAIRSELSDVLLHLAFQLVIGEEKRQFTAGDIADLLEAKMRRRHPHLFDLGGKEPWERIKRRERRGRTLAGLVVTLPPLLMAYRLQERAAGVGFDWPDVTGPLAKIREELEEVERELEAPGPAAFPVNDGDPNAPRSLPSERVTDEIGDLLFAVVNLARKAGVQAGPALDGANRKFRRRFEAVEALAAQQGVDIEGAGLEMLDGWWNEVKAGEGGTA